MLNKLLKPTMFFAVITLSLAVLLTIAIYSKAAGDDTTDNDAARDFQPNTTENVLAESKTDDIGRDENLAVDSSDTVLYFDEHPAFSQKDLSDNFLHYAEGDSRADLPQPDHAEDVANVVGVVLDKRTKRPVSNATIFVDETAMVCTGDDGRFQIKNLPNGTYEWRVAATGYYDSQYLNYSVHWADGTDIFTFHLSDSTSIIEDSESMKRYS